jgi:hypothetical protein
MKRMMMWMAIATIAAACGGDSGTAALSRSEAREICTDACEKDRDCGEIADVDGCVSSCVDSIEIIRGDLVRELFDCYMDASCAADDDCADTIDVEPLSEHEDYAAACREKLAECGASSSDIAEVCDVEHIKVIASDIIEDLTDCWDEPCEAIPSCFESALP